MVKCPNCGSIAQVLKSPIYTINNGEKIGQNCKCGCGTCFTVYFKVDEIKICKI